MFTVANGSSTHRQALNDRPCCSPSAPKRGDLVLFVAPLCIKGLRLVTARLPEKSSPIAPGLNQLPLLRVLRVRRQSVLGSSLPMERCYSPHGGCRQLAEEERVLGTLNSRAIGRWWCASCPSFRYPTPPRSKTSAASVLGSMKPTFNSCI